MKRIIIIISSLLLCHLVSINAQEMFGEFDAGPNGEFSLTNTDNEYSAFVLRGPNQPCDEGSKRDLVFKFRAAGKSIIRSYRGGNWDTFLQFLTTPYNDALPQVRMHISDLGNIGIGTTTPQHKLDINGTIRAKEILVNVDAGADHIFHPEYELTNLSDLKSFVKENKHLPDIPSEKQMQKEGLNVNEFQIKLLQKIEELTLYIIKQDETINNPSQQIEHLNHRLNQLNY